MSRSQRLLTIAAVAAPIAASVLALPAQADMCGDELITAHVSDTTPASGQQFVVKGKFLIGDDGAADHVVKVQTRRDGKWQQLSGARVSTNAEGKYRVRVILSQRGPRTLRVVGVGQAHEMTVWKKFSVTVS